jgi:hypothetical protein
MTLHKGRVGEPEVDFSPVFGAEALSLVHRLTLTSFSLAGLTLPTYTRAQIPCRFVPDAQNDRASGRQDGCRPPHSHARFCWLDRSLRIFTNHEDAKRAEREEIARMTPAERLRIGADLHAFWVRNYHRNASRLDRTLQIAQRSPR